MESKCSEAHSEKKSSMKFSKGQISHMPGQLKSQHTATHEFRTNTRYRTVQHTHDTPRRAVEFVSIGPTHLSCPTFLHIPGHSRRFVGGT